jgi:hypothetical protein
MSRTITTATIYVDSQDPQDSGWAWRVRYTDGHEESGGAEDVADAVVQCAAYGAALDISAWTHLAHDGGSYEWRS